MSKVKDITGQKFTRLTVISRSDKTGPRKSSVWNCICDCGTSLTVPIGSLSSGNTRSCGCLQKDTVSSMMRKHGMSKTRIYNIWNGILTRCKNQNHHSYARYGAVGLTVCDRWLSFDNFITDMGECPYKHSIDRIDNSKGYEPDNCRWVEQRVQNRNQRSNVFLTFNGKTMCQTDWATETGIKRETIARRMKLGWETERILTEPPSSTMQIFMFNNERMSLKQIAVRLHCSYYTLYNWIVRKNIPLNDVCRKLQLPVNTLISFHVPGAPEETQI